MLCWVLAEVPNAEDYPIPPDLIEMSIEDLNTSIRLHNALANVGIKTVGQIANMTENQFLRLRNIGTKQRNEMRELLSSLGTAFRRES